MKHRAFDDLGEFGEIDCQACGFSDARFEFCELECLPDGKGGWINASSYGTPLVPHMHRPCVRCGFSWLENLKGAV